MKDVRSVSRFILFVHVWMFRSSAPFVEETVIAPLYFPCSLSNINWLYLCGISRVNINILEISELKWTGMGEFNTDVHYIDYCEEESLRRNGVAIIVNKRVQKAVLGCNVKNDRMTSVCFQGKPFSIIVIQVYAPSTSAEEAEIEQFYEDLQDLLELIPKKMPFSS